MAKRNKRKSKKSLSNVLQGVLLTPGEVQKYRIRATQGSIIKASISSDQDIYPLVEIISKSGKLQSASTSYNEKSASTGMVMLGEGKHYILVKTQIRETGSFTLRLEAQESENAMLDEVFRLTNKERLSHGLQPLIRNTKLDLAADTHSENMGIHNIYSHTGFDGSSVGDRITGSGYNWMNAAENIYKSPFSPEEAVAGWMNSPGHRANILSPKFKEIGLGYFFDADDSTTYWTQNFATSI